MLDNPSQAFTIIDGYPGAVAISALEGDGIAELKEFLAHKLYEDYQKIVVELPARDNNLIALFHNQGKVDKIEHNLDRVMIEGRLPGRLVARYAQFINREQEEDRL